jgi:hypothetical protein
MFDRFVMGQQAMSANPAQPVQPPPVDESDLLSQLLTKPSQVLNNIEQRVEARFIYFDPFFSFEMSC